MSNHQQDLSRAFDGQAAKFERAPVQSDPAALGRLVAFASLPPGASVLDAGCGPGLVAEAFLAAGFQVHGIDLSPVMVERARARCAPFGDRARFEVGSIEALAAGPFDAAVSRYVVHHVEDPLAFVAAQVARLRPEGTLLVCDHVTDPEPGAAQRHIEVERARDRTHTRNLTTGGLADLCARAGLVKLAVAEEPFELDFDEWFDRGTPSTTKAEARILAQRTAARGFDAISRPDGGLTIRCVRTMVRGHRPDPM